MRTPSSAFPALPHGLVEGLGRSSRRTAARLAFPPAASLTTFLPAVLFAAVFFMAALAVALFCVLRVAIFFPSVFHCVLPYFLRTPLFRLTFPIRPPSVPPPRPISPFLLS